MTTGEYLILWTAFGLFILPLWGLMMGDAGGSKKSDIAVTLVCFILGFPVFITIVALFSLTSRKRKQQ